MKSNTKRLKIESKIPLKRGVEARKGKKKNSTSIDTVNNEVFEFAEIGHVKGREEYRIGNYLAAMRPHYQH
jgi:hypothetical protein